MGIPHKHRDVIIAWANGAQIQFLDGDEWIDCHDHAPRWHEEMRYRVKPKTVKREGWVNVYKYGPLRAAALSPAFHTKEEADQDAICDRVACIRIEWEEEV